MIRKTVKSNVIKLKKNETQEENKIDLSKDIISKIEKLISEIDPLGDWNIGETSNEPISNADQENIIDTENYNPNELSRLIDQAIQEGQFELNKEENKKSLSKDSKFNNKISDRLKIESISSINWANIFKSRLIEYSKEKSKMIPYHRRFIGSNKVLSTKIPNKIQNKDTVPELNISIDTSASLSNKELSIILSEIKNAVNEAKIKKINLILWASSVYFFKSYDTSNLSFKNIEKDIQDNIKTGGTNINKMYEELINKKVNKKFTIIFTDGYVDHEDSNTNQLAQKALDFNNSIFIVTFPTTNIEYSLYNNIMSPLPGEKIPLFLNKLKNK